MIIHCPKNLIKIDPQLVFVILLLSQTGRQTKPLSLLGTDNKEIIELIISLIKTCQDNSTG